MIELWSTSSSASSSMRTAGVSPSASERLDRAQVAPLDLEHFGFVRGLGVNRHRGRTR